MADSIINGVDYGPLAGLAGTWRGDKGMDVAPGKDGSNKHPYYESLMFEAIGDGSESAEIWVLPGEGHATDLFDHNPDLHQRLNDWIVDQLRVQSSRTPF